MDDKRWEIGGLIAVGAIIVFVILNFLDRRLTHNERTRKNSPQRNPENCSV